MPSPELSRFPELTRRETGRGRLPDSCPPATLLSLPKERGEPAAKATMTTPGLPLDRSSDSPPPRLAGPGTR